MIDRFVIFQLCRINVIGGSFFLTEIRRFKKLLQQDNLSPFPAAALTRDSAFRMFSSILQEQLICVAATFTFLIPSTSLFG
jgi:hypothetical protein